MPIVENVLTTPGAVVAAEFAESNAALSPDGRRLAYQSNETGRNEVYVTSFPVPGRKWQVSQGEGMMPAWRGDGREVYYRDERGLWAAEVDGASAVLGVGAVRRLFDLPGNFAPARQYDITPGRRAPRRSGKAPGQSKPTVSTSALAPGEYRSTLPRPVALTW